MDIKNSKTAKSIAHTFVFGMVLTLALGVITSGEVKADEDKSDYLQQVELAQEAFDSTGDAHFKAKCSLAQAKQVARANGLEIEGSPAQWDAIIQECLGKSQKP